MNSLWLSFLYFLLQNDYLGLNQNSEISRNSAYESQ